MKISGKFISTPEKQKLEDEGRLWLRGTLSETNLVIFGKDMPFK